ncbi:RNA polymerase sigma factor SigJ [Microbacterium azadirachtae]|uniref:RNA polymerase sigma factor SigJ n=1 Tax=Microbacterium azadirachtae TaxID=582680 RepID=UPI0008834667|nr:RNA polymerase sigma factor SigJ [Microbacterium azadirachtae]SDL91319.1 RNA polymerase, sigma subunit, ECF family [Microbacterium azadirachtae]SEG16488.1 RNA polymerase, sigma subunit, ECF family [Microbacterium azadirachtae]SEG18968.1 RNA polymerase, sigma subunit, ECF family [Microbacterium azadirachtae]
MAHLKPAGDLPAPRTPLALWRSVDESELPGQEDGEDHSGVGAFLRSRPRLFGIAYRMLGSVAEAEDVVQEAWMRWQAYDRQSVREPEAFLATTTTRLAMNELQSARARRETYIGPWLPEPIDTDADPELVAERSETLRFAILILLERLTPAERAAYVLHEAFGYPYRQIAEVISTTEDAARQLASRARRRITAERRRPVGDAEQRRLLQAFIDAARSGDIAALESLLTEDVVGITDGGGLANAARVPLVGRERVVQVTAAVSKWIWQEATVRIVQANAQAWAVLEVSDGPVMMFTVEASEEGIDRMLWLANTAKLGAVFATGAP